MTYFRSLVVLISLFAISTCGQAQTFTERVVRGIDQPVFATSPVGDTERLFVLEQASGNILILDLATGDVADEPFLTVPQLATGGERGLLGLAFHPDYATNGNFYVYASQPGGSQNHRSQIFEYSVAGDAATSNVADADSQRSILRIDQPFSNHNGGWIGFDPTAEGDARNQLFVATGDGGSGNDPENNSQDVSNLLGNILRIDVSGDAFPDDSIQNYSIPTSNPFVDADGRDEIFAYGLRNPWRNSFDRETGDLWIGDVGQREVEEINTLPAGTSGQNYGWRVMEGTQCFDTGDSRDGNLQCGDVSLTAPVYEYGHGGGEFRGNSVTGGYVYRGPLEEFQGQYFFGDFASGHIWTRDPDSGTVINRNDTLEADIGAANSTVASFAEDGVGNLYVVNYTGSLYRVDSTSRDARWVGTDATSGVAGDGETWGDPNNWIRDGVADTVFEPGDHLIVGGEARSVADRRISALTFDGNSSLSSTANIEIVSGNITVPAESSSALLVSNGGQLLSPVGAIRKLGGGNLYLENPSADSPIYVKDGAVTLGGSAASIVLDQGTTLSPSAEGAVVENLDSDAGELVLSPTINEDGFLVNDPLLEIGSLSGLATVTVVSPLDRLSLEEGQRTSVTLAVTGDIENGDLDGFRFDNQFGELFLPGHQGFGQVVNLVEETNLDGETELVLEVFFAYQGDADLDGTVGFNDFLTLSSNFGEEGGGWESGDFGDGIVAFSDFLQLTNNFGLTAVDIPAALPVAGAAAVPEPSTGVLGVFAILGLFVVRRRR